MTDKLLIERELLTRTEMNDALCEFSGRWVLDGDYIRCVKCKRPHIASKADQEFVHAADCTAPHADHKHPWQDLRNMLRGMPAPRQPEGEGLEVVATLRVEFDEGDEGIAIETVETHVLCDEGETELCRLSDAQSAIAELREECEHWKSGANAEAARADELKAERDTLRQQLAEMTKDRDDCLSARKHYVEKVGDALAQNYTLAGLLAKAQEELDPHRHAVLWGEICAALAEVKP